MKWSLCRRWAALIFWLAIPPALALTPPELVEHGPCVCIFKHLTGHDCPGCGITRAMVRACHGDLAAAWHHNPMIVIVGPLMGYLWVRAALSSLSKIKKNGGRVHPFYEEDALPHHRRQTLR